MRKITLYIIFIFIINFGLNAQQIPINNQHLVNKSAVVPAFSGYNGNIESFLTYRQSWIGITGAPKFGLVNVNGALNKDMGFGFYALSDKSGNLGQTFIVGSYAYHLHINDQMTISAAISPSYYRNQLNISGIESNGIQIDPMLLNTKALKINAFDVGISLGFSYSKFRFGLNVPQTIGMTYKFNEVGNSFGLKRHYLGFASYIFSLNNLTIEPVAMIASTEKSPINYVGSVMFKYKDRVWTNIGYGANKSVLFAVGVRSGRSLVFSYAYEFGIGGMPSASLGTHELTIGFLIKPAKTYDKYATVFGNSVSSDDKKLKVLEQQLTQERNARIIGDNKLQNQIDSLAGMIGKGGSNEEVVTQQNGISWIQRVRTQNITFSLMNAKIFSSSYSEIDKYVTKLSADPSLKVKILVYTDNQFSESINKQMSDDRAKAVADYILSKPGIKSEQVTYKGMGNADPISDNTTSVGREENNRVELLFNKKIF